MEYHGFRIDEEVEVIEGKHQGVDWVVVGGTKCFVDLQKKNSGERAKAMPKNIRSRQQQKRQTESNRLPPMPTQMLAGSPVSPVGSVRR